MSGDAGRRPVTYAAAGVDTEAGDKAVELMKDAVRATHGPQVLGGVGGFAGLYDASRAADGYRKPLLATSTDGVGTKVAIAQALDIHDTIGFDLVGMVVDDIVVVGAKPLFMTDYIACGRVVPERIAGIVRGIAAACAVAGTALVGGETAEHPGLLGPDEYDVAGAATGVVEADQLLGPERVRAGDVLRRAGVERSALQRLLAGAQGRLRWPAGRSTGTSTSSAARSARSSWSRPASTRRDCLALAERAGVAGLHAYSHVTGGGLASNVARVLPAGLVADVDRGGWTLPPIFSLVQRLGSGAVDRPRGHAQPRRRHGGDRRARRRRRGPRARARARPAGLGRWAPSAHADPATDVVGAPGLRRGDQGRARGSGPARRAPTGPDPRRLGGSAARGTVRRPDATRRLGGRGPRARARR